jgi:hypothetical protein
MKFLIDHNLGGHAEILFGSLASQGWVDMLSIQFFTFQEMKLPINSSDRIVWRLAQAHQMMILTANRSMKGEESLEEVLREENGMTSFPVITIGDANRLLSDRSYRNRCGDRLIEILLELEIWMGVGRLYIP